MTIPDIPEIMLNDGVMIPQMGFGTMDLAPARDNSLESHEVTAQLVLAAIEAGYRHLDTAQMYANEKGVGLGISRAGLHKDEFFLTSKLGNGNHHPEDVRRSFEETLTALGVDKLDLFLMHWPVPTLYNGDYVSTWRAMTQLIDEGLLRSAGVSNFQPEHLKRIIEETGHIPSVNQIQVHPYYGKQELFTVCADKGIAIEAWSPLGQAAVINDPAIVWIADKLGRTPAEVVLRWHLQRGRIVIPKTVSPAHMVKNISVVDFTLTPEQLSIIDDLNKGEVGRRGPDPYTFDWIPDDKNTKSSQ